MLKITRQALLSALQGAKETHPNEFICLLRGDKQGEDWLITEVILTPFASYDKESSSYSPYFIPVGGNEIASFHSHPYPNTAYPSNADLQMFSRTARFHFIASNPYRIQDTNAFNSKGEKISFELV
ncbi:Mov34/MPN/PAD-1 family protein [Candidatus Micrarchaeota archaeon]|nr:Mov34/MPN/PAD-1 family protein [Candidatus Micrarchaeota archaeon]